MYAHFGGRLRELDRVDRLLAGSGAGQGKLAAVVGEAGLGKTRLMGEIARLAAARGHQVAWSQLIEDPVAPPFLAWLLALRDCFARASLDELREDLGSGASDVADLVPELRDRLRLPPSRPSADGAAARFQLFDSVTRFLLAHARRRPLVLLFDNAHVADRSSLQLLEYYSRQLAGSPTLVLVSYRPSEVGADHPLRTTLAQCSRVAGFESLELAGLARPEAADLLRVVLGYPAPAPLVDAVCERGDGNPLFVAQVAAGLARAAPAEAGPTDFPIEVPDSLKAVIEARLQALDADVRDVLRIAAIVGRDFDAALLAPLAGREPADLLSLLSRAVVAGAVVPLAVGRFRFAHALFREVLYGQHSPDARVQLHRSAVARIEQRNDGDPQAHVAQLAYHAFEAARGGYLPQAVDYCRRAAQHATSRRAHGDAAVQLERALQVHELAEHADAAERFRLLDALGDAQFRAGQLEGAARTYLRCAVLAQRHGWWPRLADAVLALQYAQGQLGVIHLASVPLHELALSHLPADARAMRARLLASLASACRRQEERARGRAAFDESLALARDVGDPAVLYECLSHALLVLQPVHEAERQATLLREALAIAERSGRPEDVLAATSALLFPLSKLGAYDELQSHLARLHERTDAARHPHYRQVAAGFEAQVALLQGRWRDALRLAKTSLQQAALEGSTGVEGRFGFQMFAVQRALGNLGSVGPLLARLSDGDDAGRLWLPGKILLHVELGQFDEARRLLDRLGDPGRLPQDDLYETALVYLADACVELRDARRCQQLYDLLKPYRARNVTLMGTTALGSGAGVLGRLAAALRLTREARALYEEALGFEAAMGAPVLLARTQTDLAALLRQSDRHADRDRAGQLLREARATAERLGLRALAARIDAMSAEGAAETLTDRELDVLRWMAAGASNKKIAHELTLSVTTVATHVRNILRKTGTSNRTAAVAHARRSHLIHVE